MTEVRVLVMTNYTYTYGSKASYKICGDSMYFNPSLDEHLDELKFILDSSFYKKGWLYVEDNIKEDFKNKVGIFAEKVVVPEEVTLNDNVKSEQPVEEEIAELPEEPLITEPEVTLSIEDRKSQLEEKKAAEVRVLAEQLGLVEYTNKSSAIEFILKVEYTK
jgi:hypothetical protein